MFDCVFCCALSAAAGWLVWEQPQSESAETNRIGPRILLTIRLSLLPNLRDTWRIDVLAPVELAFADRFHVAVDEQAAAHRLMAEAGGAAGTFPVVTGKRAGGNRVVPVVVRGQAGGARGRADAGGGEGGVNVF